MPVPSLLEGMRRKELVEPTGTYWGDEPVHRFHHVLIRDAAYRRLLKTTRADLHQRVAVWTDAQRGRPHRRARGGHRVPLRAGLPRTGASSARSTPTTERVGRRAAELLSIAAQRALGRDDLASAGALARRALAVIPTDDHAARAELLLIACECFLASGDVAAGAPLVARARPRSPRATTQLGGVGGVLRSPARRPHRSARAASPPTRRRPARPTTLQALGDGAGEAKAHQVRAGAARAARPRRRRRSGARPRARRRARGRRPAPGHRGARRRAGRRALRPEPRRARRWSLSRRRAPPAHHDGVAVGRGHLDALPGGARSATRPLRRVAFDARVGARVARGARPAPRTARDRPVHRHGRADRRRSPRRDRAAARRVRGAGHARRRRRRRTGRRAPRTRAARSRATSTRPIAMATASEELAGQNLKTAIAWRVARAEVLAARGDVDWCGRARRRRRRDRGRHRLTCSTTPMPALRSLACGSQPAIPGVPPRAGWTRSASTSSREQPSL